MILICLSFRMTISLMRVCLTFYSHLNSVIRNQSNEMSNCEIFWGTKRYLLVLFHSKNVLFLDISLLIFLFKTRSSFFNLIQLMLQSNVGFYVIHLGLDFFVLSRKLSCSLPSSYPFHCRLLCFILFAFFFIFSIFLFLSLSFFYFQIFYFHFLLLFFFLFSIFNFSFFWRYQCSRGFRWWFLFRFRTCRIGNWNK